MKKLIAAGLIAASLVPMSAIGAGAVFGREYTAPKGTPTIDGKVDAIWQNAEWTNVDKPYDGKEYKDASLRVKLLWDSKNIYFLAEVVDTDLNLENDVVEIYLDENNVKNTGDYDAGTSQTKFKSDASAPAFKDKYNPRKDAVCKSTRTDNGWILEGSIPWATGNAKEGAVMGLEFMYNCGTKDKDFATALRWNIDTANGDLAPYKGSKDFGKLTLGAAPKAAEKPSGAAQTPDLIVVPFIMMSVAGAAAFTVSRKKSR